MELNSFRSWLEAYGAAWEARDPEASARLFEEDGTYQVTPFLEPMRGQQAILEYWTQVARTQEDIKFGCEVLALTSEMGIARWWASFVRIPAGALYKVGRHICYRARDSGRVSEPQGVVAQRSEVNDRGVRKQTVRENRG
jgi:hypothetical protein